MKKLATIPFILFIELFAMNYAMSATLLHGIFPPVRLQPLT